MKVKDALKRFRREFQLKQVEVAKILGIRPQSYQLYEYGKVSPSIPIILKLTDTFNISTDYLLGRSDNPRDLPVDSELIEAIRACQKAISPVWEKCAV